MSQKEHLCVTLVPLFNHLDWEDQKKDSPACSTYSL